ncbi:MAG: DUF2059 domain-containing protein [Marivibrio sp.]|uniref:DUF2059 domain-containing protein n=1 Tax=Marivibrio sp. TaxID=2039719 RepID=UPI0032EB848A
MTSKLRSLALAGCLVASSALAPPAAAEEEGQPSDAYRAEVAKFLDLANIAQLFDEVMLQMWATQKAAIEELVRRNAAAEGETVDEERLSQRLSRLGELFLAEFRKAELPLVDLYTALYTDHFTLEEIKYLNWVYSRPTMKKFNRLQPQIMQESGPALGAWGARVGEQAMTRALERLEAEGAAPLIEQPS